MNMKNIVIYWEYVLNEDDKYILMNFSNIIRYALEVSKEDAAVSYRNLGILMARQKRMLLGSDGKGNIDFYCT